MNLLDPKALDESLELLAGMPKPPRVMVTITMQVPVDDLDLSGCKIEYFTDLVEFWGGKHALSVSDVDLSSVTFAGFPCEIASQSEDTVIDYLLERDSE